MGFGPSISDFLFITLLLSWLPSHGKVSQCYFMHFRYYSIKLTFEGRFANCNVKLFNLSVYNVYTSDYYKDDRGNRRCEPFFSKFTSITIVMATATGEFFLGIISMLSMHGRWSFYVFLFHSLIEGLSITSLCFKILSNFAKIERFTWISALLSSPEPRLPYTCIVIELIVTMTTLNHLDLSLAVLEKYD